MSARGGAVSGVTALDLLAVLFIGLKLGGVIAWSWWLVLLPWLVPLGLVLVVLVLFALFKLCSPSFWRVRSVRL